MLIMDPLPRIIPQVSCLAICSTSDILGDFLSCDLVNCQRIGMIPSQTTVLRTNKLTANYGGRVNCKTTPVIIFFFKFLCRIIMSFLKLKEHFLDAQTWILGQCSLLKSLFSLTGRSPHNAWGRGSNVWLTN